ncbi:MAG: hypothetical protein ACJAX5_001304 [Patiriisocius sp.]|jgi:hypothetical protein
MYLFDLDSRSRAKLTITLADNLSGEDLSEQAVYSFTSKTFGAATVAIPHPNHMWLGTFHGDRIASFNLPTNE